MNELQVLIETNLPAILQNNELNKEEKRSFALGVAKLSGAKNIQLLDGTLKIWENCLVNDINRLLFTFEEFLQAMDISIRKTAYNRLDYADIYKQAIIISHNNFTNNKKLIKCLICNKEHLPFKAFTTDLWNSVDCYGDYHKLKQLKEYQYIINCLTFLDNEYKEFI